MITRSAMAMTASPTSSMTIRFPSTCDADITPVLVYLLYRLPLTPNVRLRRSVCRFRMMLGLTVKRTCAGPGAPCVVVTTDHVVVMPSADRRPAPYWVYVRNPCKHYIVKIFLFFIGEKVTPCGQSCVVCTRGLSDDSAVGKSAPASAEVHPCKKGQYLQGE